VTSRKIVASPTIHELASSFQRSLVAQNKSPKTVKAYMEAVRLLDRYLTHQGMPNQVAPFAGTILRPSSLSNWSNGGPLPPITGTVAFSSSSNGLKKRGRLRHPQWLI
jgi:hypothetical protein